MKTIFLAILVCILSAQISQAQWQPDVRLTNSPSPSFTSSNRCVASSGDSVHVVWRDYRDGNSEIYYKRSTDGGVSWGADIRQTSNYRDSFYPSVAVSGSVVHVVWHDDRDTNYEIYYKRSIDGGVNWSSDARLTTNSAYSEVASVSVSGSTVHVVWEDDRDRNYEIYYKRSTDGGASWGVDTRLTNNSPYSESPSVSVSGSDVHVVWQDNRDGNYEIYYKRSTDGGVSWGADTRLTSNSLDSYRPSLSVSDSTVHVVWEDNRDGNNDIYYKRSTDAGISWGTDTRLTSNSLSSFSSSVSVSGAVVHVVWGDNRDANYEIYYKRSTDGGINWGTDTRLTNNSAFSEYPSVSVSGSTAHVVWQDKRDGNYEIYYKRDPTGNVTGIENIGSELPEEFDLAQNYPNPFNPTTEIRFQMSEVSHVMLRVFDVLGREVATLVNQPMESGTYSVQFDATNLSSGIYFYRVQTEKFTDTKRMLLLK